MDGEYVFRLCSTTGNRGPPCSWMKDAKETPASYNKKTRPAWFSEEVTSFRGYGDIKYAGQMMRRSALRVLPHVAALFSLRLGELMQHCEIMHPSASSC